jgi:His-Xaa-Ser system protein HxsD
MKLPGIPEELAGADLEEGSVHVVLDDSVYPLEAIYGASFVFIDRAFVFVDRPEDGKYRVVLTPKKGKTDEATLKTLVGELANELLANAWRHEITKENRATIEAVTMQAIAGAMGPPSLDELEDFDFSEEPFDDPLGIAQSWEEKYQKKGKKENEEQ